MPEKQDKLLTRWRRILATRRRYDRKLVKRHKKITVAIAKLRATIIKRHAKLSTTNVDRAIKWALDQVGTTENPPGSNSGPKISEWIKAGGGSPGWAWCQYFANQVAVHGDCPQVTTGYTVYVLNGNYKHLGFNPVPIADVKRGDFVYFKFPYAGAGGDRADHVGVYIGDGKTVEGNTSSGNSGSQSNGGGVYIRTRPKNQWAGVVRPPYNS